jgi:hypothetical protein
MPAFRIVERTEDARFPHRIRMEQDGHVLVVVRAQDVWPGRASRCFACASARSIPTNRSSRSNRRRSHIVRASGASCRSRWTARAAGVVNS